MGRAVGLSHDVEGNGVPVLAVCGFSGSGKTTLLEAAIPRLVGRGLAGAGPVGRGLAVAVVKHDAHGFEADRPGKDSDRLFRAGATVALSGPEQQFERRHATAMLSLEETLARLGRDHDLVLVEGHKDIDLPKVWLGNAERTAAPDSVTNIVRTLPWKGEAGSGDRLAAFMEYIDEWLPGAWNRRPLYGGLLVGGMSSRMGSPKQLVRFGGRTLGEIAVAALDGGLGDARTAESRTAESRTVALGEGVLPQAVEQMRRLPDSPGFAGPGAGLIAAHRWAPEAAWIVAACDHPWLRPEHIEWLARQRQPGRWAVIPRQADGHPCPTLALYEPQALEAMERRSRTDGSANPSSLLDMPRTVVLEPPAELADGWKNVNTPEELRAEESRGKVTAEE
jgi:molybdopterin-guanine dinucleotide biosynthesis protein MobB